MSRVGTNRIPGVVEIVVETVVEIRDHRIWTRRYASFNRSSAVFLVARVAALLQVQAGALPVAVA